jgi:hypothetical protein
LLKLHVFSWMCLSPHSGVVSELDVKQAWLFLFMSLRDL